MCSNDPDKHGMNERKGKQKTKKNENEEQMKNRL